MSKKTTKTAPFSTSIQVRGQLFCSFCFTNENEIKNWLRDQLPSLEKKYGKLTLLIKPFHSLKTGDTCYVNGEGNDEFKIIDVVKNSENRYSFVLDTGWTEEVNKCYIDKSIEVSKEIRRIFTPTELKKIGVRTDLSVKIEAFKSF